MIDADWWLTKDGDRACLELYNKHYSARQYKDGRVRKLFCGPGEKIVLRTWEGDAMFVWRKFIDDCEFGYGVNCAVFRNESKIKSSRLIHQADKIAAAIWPGERHYTYVDAKKIKSGNPGFCFIKAGWRRMKDPTKGGLVVLEKVNYE